MHSKKTALKPQTPFQKEMLNIYLKNTPKFNIDTQNGYVCSHFGDAFYKANHCGYPFLKISRPFKQMPRNIPQRHASNLIGQPEKPKILLRGTCRKNI